MTYTGFDVSVNFRFLIQVRAFSTPGGLSWSRFSSNDGIHVLSPDTVVVNLDVRLCRSSGGWTSASYGSGLGLWRSGWVLWRTEWHWDYFFRRVVRFQPVSIIPPLFRIHVSNGAWSVGPLGAVVQAETRPYSIVTVRSPGNTNIDKFNSGM